ncbi:MAG: exodeoxyribonuclease VII large subunit [Ornithinimicrobium sp.]
MRVLSLKMADYVEKMSPLWVEGQVIQLNRRPGMNTAFLTLRDTDVDMSLSVSIPVPALDAMPSPPQQGSRVVIHAKPSFWTKRGTLQLEARQMRHIGVGELLARLEHLKQLLRSEGLFDTRRKRALPFLPRRIGLIVGRNTAAERDVLAGTARRWPSAEFTIRQVPVQGSETVLAVSGALAELDKDPAVDVIVIARGGGSFEDLLPFSNEALLRAVSACATPVVSAIGHESDTPLLDLVADLRASTPTHAATAIVPDRTEEVTALHTHVSRGRRRLAQHLGAERAALTAVISRPVMRDRRAILAGHRETITSARAASRLALHRSLSSHTDQLNQRTQHLRAVSPGHTLRRGYAVVRLASGDVVRARTDVSADDVLRVTVARGDFAARPVSS